jgi:lactate dehydrogenase-like 2-hydroxyacid dehydrogenase
MPPRVVVTEPEFQRVGTVFASTTRLACHAAPSGEAELAAAILRLGARHAIVGPQVYRGPLYAALKPGGVLARFGVGYDGIDLARATESGILCTNTPGVLDQSVAELSMLLVAAAARHLVSLDVAMRQGRWMLRTGAELSGKTLAIIGSGRIGTATARIAAHGYGMRVVGCRRSARGLDADLAASGFAAVTADFGQAVEQADYVCLLIPGIPENVRYLNRARLSLLAPHAWLINAARGVVVDEAALYDALAERRIAGAALDVYDREPYEPVDASRDLRRLDNVILAPHIGSNTAEANRRMSERAIRNVLFGEVGEVAAMDLLNPDVLRR